MGAPTQINVSVQLTPINVTVATVGVQGPPGQLQPFGTVARPEKIPNKPSLVIKPWMRQIIFIEGNGGAIALGASPQIQRGSTVGQELVLAGCSNVNVVKISNGNGILGLSIGTVAIRNGSTVSMVWDGTNWRVTSTNLT